MRTCGLLVAGCLVGAIVTERGLAQDWPRFRGPNGSGLAMGTSIPIQWTEKDFNWKVELPGVGHSSPVAWGDRLFVPCGEEQTGKRIILCLRAEDGKMLWSRSFPGERHGKHQDNSFASATPTVDAHHLYVAWGSPKDYLVVALDHSGKEVWRTDLGPVKSGHGFGASPIVHEDLLVLPNDQDGTSFLLGLDCKTGKERWKVTRKSKTSYATPCVYQPRGRAAQILFTSYEQGITSIDPKTGRVIRELDVFDKRHVETPIGSPIVAGDLVLATCGWLGVRQEVVAVRPPDGEGQAKPKELYRIDRSAPLCTTPLVNGELLFLWSDGGMVTCADVRTGDVHWRERVPGSYYASPVCLGNQLCNISRTGEVVVLAAAKRFELLGRNPLGEGSHSTPAVVKGRLYLRTFRHIISIGGKKDN